MFYCSSSKISIIKQMKKPKPCITVIKHSGHLRTLEKCRKHSPVGRVFYISLVFSNSPRVLSQGNKRLRLLYLLKNKEKAKAENCCSFSIMNYFGHVQNWREFTKIDKHQRDNNDGEDWHGLQTTNLKYYGLFRMHKKMVKNSLEEMLTQ